MARQRSYARRGAVREPYDYVLIVCEGKKTEPNYFSGLTAAHRLRPNVEVVPSDGTDPMSIVQYAEEALARKGYDKTYCVFDRNGHDNYDAAINRILSSEAGKSHRLFAIPSVPCFEVWLLLHFNYSTAPFNKTGARSPCDNVLRELKRHIADYNKGRPGIYDALANKIDNGITNAKRLEAHNAAARSSNPLTNVHHLVAYLKNLKQ